MLLHIGGKSRGRYGVPFDGYSVFHFGEHRTAPTEISFLWEVNFGINLRVIVFVIPSLAFTYRY